MMPMSGYTPTHAGEDVADRGGHVGSGRRWAGRSLVAGVLLIPLLFGLLGVGTSTPEAQASPAPTGLHAVGNRIVDGAGQTVRLRGVNYSGTEYACIQGWGIFDGPNNLASVQAIASWKANAVRLPLNEDCWLGINGVAAAYGGANYQAAIAGYVALLTQNGLIPVLEVHWSAPGTQQATGQQPMLDRDHSVELWRQIAAAFKGNTSVVFDLHNEPHPDGNRDTTAAWTCWRDGGACPGISYQAAGMQELVTAVRGTGATNLIMLGGVQYANTLTRWLAYKPTDPLNNLAASAHVYPTGNLCGSVACYDAQYAPVAQQVPLIAGEFGESVNDSVCGVSQSNILLDWLDQHNAGYLAWVWNTWGTSCGDLSLILDFAGTPHAPNGTNYKARLAAVSQSTPTPPPPPTPTLTPTPTPAPVCTPRPKVVVSMAGAGSGTLQVSITASTTAGAPNNRLRELRFGAATNAKIDVRGIVGAVGGFTVTLTDRPQQVGFAVHRAIAGLATTAPVVAVDDCGDWPTFVGGGPSAL
jgi:hypothetical protein